MGIRDHKDEIISMRLAGMGTVEIGKHLGVCNSIISRYLCDWGYRTRKRDESDWAKASVRRTPKQKTANQFEPGKRYGDYVFLETVHGATTLHRFRHKSGWSTCFTDVQLKEAKVG